MADENQPDHAKELATIKTKLDTEAAERKKAETALQAIFDDTLKDVPEGSRDLIPATLSLGDKITWTRSAIKRGVFEKKPGVTVDQSRPKTTPQGSMNLDGMNPEQKMASGYKTAHA